MQVVGDLVRLDADEGGFHLVDREVEFLHLHIGQGFGESLLGAGEEVLPVIAAAPHKVLPQAGLRFVDAHADVFPARQPEEFGRQALLVQAVARLVQDAEKGFVEEVEVVAGGDAHIPRPDAGAEGWVTVSRRPAARS